MFHQEWSCNVQDIRRNSGFDFRFRIIRGVGADAEDGRHAEGQDLCRWQGHALYTFDKDAGGKSTCNGPCAENWPPLAAADDAKPTADMTIVVRDDGKKMWAYKGKPLYTFKKDTAPGESNGDGFLNGAWHMAKP
jgi:predicted lipoprotein with Yx(FWY)xxD motif